MLSARYRLSAGATAVLAFTAVGSARQVTTRALTRADYARASKDICSLLTGRWMGTCRRTTLLVVEALIKANKDFDLLMLPNQGHSYGSVSSYMTRRRWDYFVRHLLGSEPPEGYELKPPSGASGTGS